MPKSDGQSENENESLLGKSSIFHHRSYAAATNQHKESIETYFKNRAENNTYTVVEIARARDSLSESIACYDRKIFTSALTSTSSFTPAYFNLVNEAELQQKKEELLFAFRIYSAQFQLDLAEDRMQNLDELKLKIFHCTKLLATLQFIQDKKGGDFAAEMHRAIDDTDKHLKYFIGEIAVQVLQNTMLKIISANDSVIIMSEINSYRLYRVWANALIDSTLALFLKEAEQAALNAPSSIAGYMSWVLYYLRGMFQTALLFKHAIPGPWMSKEEREIPWRERLATQVKKRKFRLLNDWIWATANLACFYWLIGSGAFGVAGNALTALLLLMDAILTFRSLSELQSQHDLEMQRYQDDLDVLNAEPEKNAIAINQLEQDMAACEAEWKFKFDSACYDLAYAIGLLIAFSILCCLFIPTAGPNMLLIFSVVGSGLCFSLNTIYASMSSNLQLSQTQHTSERAADQAKKLLTRMQELYEESPKDNEGKLKCLYLQHNELTAKSVHQANVIPYQRTELIHLTLMNAMIPPLVFAAFMFLPLPLTSVMAVLAGGFLLAFVSNMYFRKYTERYAPALVTDDIAILNGPQVPNDKQITANSFYFYTEKNAICCKFKNVNDDVEELVFTKDEQQHLSKDFLKKIEKGQELNASDQKQLRELLKNKGYDFQLNFDEEKYNKFLENNVMNLSRTDTPSNRL